MSTIYKARSNNEYLDLDPATGEPIVVAKEQMSEIVAMIVVAAGVVIVTGVTILLIAIFLFSDLLYKI